MAFQCDIQLQEVKMVASVHRTRVHPTVKGYRPLFTGIRWAAPLTGNSRASQ